MKKRERIILIVTLAIVALALSYNFLLADAVETGAVAGSAGDLREAQETFVRNFQTLKDGGTISQEYKSIGFNLPEQVAGQDPGGTFSNQLYTLLTTQLGAKNPQIEKPSYSEIKNVDEYYFVDIELRVTGTYAELTKLLKDMERQGLLIKSFKMDSSRSGRRTDELGLDVTVARLVKHDKDSRQRLKRLGWRRVG